MYIGLGYIYIVPDLATAARCIYLSLVIANQELHILEPYPWLHSAQRKHSAWSRLACMLRSLCVPPLPRSAPSSKLSPLCVPVSPVSRGERCKSYPVALVPTLGCSRPLPPSLLLLASALSGNIIPGDVFLLSKNGPYIRTRLVTQQEENKHTGSTTPTDSFAPAWTSGRPRGGRAQVDLLLSALMPTHPRRYGEKTI